jgi:hypothetical protein
MQSKMFKIGVIFSALMIFLVSLPIFLLDALATDIVIFSAGRFLVDPPSILIAIASFAMSGWGVACGVGILKMREWARTSVLPRRVRARMLGEKKENRARSGATGSPSGKDFLQEYYRAGIAYGFLDRRVPERPQFFDRSGMAAEFIQDDKLALSIGVEARLNVSTMVKYAKLYGNLLAPNSRNKSSTRRFTRAFRSNIARASNALFIATSSSLLDLTGLKSRCSSADLASSSNPAFFVSSVSQIAFWYDSNHK